MDEVLNRAQIVAAFARWAKAEREGAEEFLSREDCDTLTTDELAARNTAALFHFAETHNKV